MSSRRFTISLFALLCFTPSSLLAQDVESRNIARELFAEHCAGCHGADGDGATHDIGDLERSIKSFGADDDLWVHPPTQAGIEMALVEGVRQTPMHAFDEELSESERSALAGYVLKLRAKLLEPQDSDSEATEPTSDADRREAAMFGEESGAVDDREAEMFGGAQEPADDRETEMFGGDSDAGATAAEAGLSDDVLSNAEIAARLAENQDKLALGAFAFLRAQYAALEEGEPEEFQLSTPALLDVYLDGRPNDRLRAYARARLSADFAIPNDAVDQAGDPIENPTAALDQLWLKFDLWRVAYVTAGKQRIKWGTGRFWNPSDFLNNERLDPLEVAVFDDRLGVSLLKLHLPIESLGWNFYAIATLDEARAPEDVGGAFRAEVLYGLTELSLSTAVRRNNPTRLAADVSTGLWLFDVSIETAVLHNDRRLYYEGDFELPATFPDEVSREDDWIPQVVVNAEVQIQYNDEDTLFVGAEYFFNDAGYPDAELYPWLFANDAFTPFYVGRHYAALYGVVAGPGNWDDTSFVVSGLGNLSDRSFITRLDISQTALTFLRWNVYGNVHFGEIGEFRYGLDVEPNVLLPDGLEIVPPLFEVGAGLQLTL